MESKKYTNINKFLNFEMSSDEESAFKNSIDYKKHKKVLDLFEDSKSIPFDEHMVLNKIKTKRSNNSKKVIPLYKKWLPLSIAASILLCVSAFYFYSTRPVSYNTIAGEFIEFSLPDESSVWLNAKSKISHNKDWETSRDITLNGEAYFEVAKGKKFTVKTPQGIVTVLGTKFNVKQRHHFFEVHCFEGTVSVTYNDTETILKANQIFSSKKSEKKIVHIEKPNWVERNSIFHDTNLNDVIDDISLQYSVEFKVNENIRHLLLKYTGSYNYSDDLENVIDALCQSLNLNYNIDHKYIYLSNAE